MILPTSVSLIEKLFTFTLFITEVLYLEGEDKIQDINETKWVKLYHYCCQYVTEI